MGNLHESGDFNWRVSDCEELVGVTYIGYFVGQVGLEPTTGRL